MTTELAPINMITRRRRSLRRSIIFFLGLLIFFAIPTIPFLLFGIKGLVVYILIALAIQMTVIMLERLLSLHKFWRIIR